MLCFTGAHLSLNLPEEVGSTPIKKLKTIKEQYEDKFVELEVTGVDVIKHTEKSGDSYWLLVFRVSRGSVESLRKKLKLDKSNYNPHIVALEKKII